MTDEAPEVIIDRSRVDAYAAARRRAMVLHSLWRPMFAGAAGAGLTILAVAVAQPRFAFREIEVPRIAYRDSTVPNIVQKDVEVDHVVPHEVPIEVPRIVAAPPETIPFASTAGKQYVGHITTVTPTTICFDRSDGQCTSPALIDANGHAVLDANGDVRPDPSVGFIDMERWIGHEAWRAPSPTDPEHLARFWVHDGDQLIRFRMERVHGATPGKPA